MEKPPGTLLHVSPGRRCQPVVELPDCLTYSAPWPALCHSYRVPGWAGTLPSGSTAAVQPVRPHLAEHIVAGRQVEVRVHVIV